MGEDNRMGRRGALAALGTAVGMAVARPARAQHEAPLRRSALGSRPLSLGGLPTPVRRLSVAPDLWLKDDGQAGDDFGGSKARKLEWLLADALDAGASRVVTCGAPASNHMLATAVHARRLGLGCDLKVLPGPRGEVARAHLCAAQGLGARLLPGTRADAAALLEAARLDDAGNPGVGLRGPGPHPIPLGGSSLRGNLGYYLAAEELERQVQRGELPAPGVIVIAAGTGGAAAGLLAGLSYTGLNSGVVAVRVASRVHVNDGRIRAEAAAISDVISRRRGLALGRLLVWHREAGPGYGRPNRRSVRALALAAADGLALDPTYSAKAFAAALTLRGQRSGPILFWNTFDPRMPHHPPVEVSDLPSSLRAYTRPS